LKELNANLIMQSQLTTKGTSILLQKPLLTAECIDSILEKANSPAQGTGKTFAQYSEQYGIDSAFMLALFRQETSLCNPSVKNSSTSTGCLNKSIGNIKCTTSTCYNGFNTYSTWEEGIKATYENLANSKYYLKAGKTTVEEIYPVWANLKTEPIAPETQNVINFTNEYREKAKKC
jgi:hypothetical protein